MVGWGRLLQAVWGLEEQMAQVTKEPPPHCGFGFLGPSTGLVRNSPFITQDGGLLGCV